MNKVFISLALLGTLFSCSDSSSSRITKKDGDVVSSIASGSKSDAELEKELAEIEEAEREREREREASSTTLKFDKIYHDFGDVGPDSDNITEFEVTNTGKIPLIIENVSASCGCTMPRKPDQPIAPGKSDVIEVKFHPKPSQKNEIEKTVTVTANTADRVHELKIRAFVKQ